MRFFFAFAIFLGWRPLNASAGLALGSGLQDSMVIQQNHPFVVWGRSSSSGLISIRADWMSGAIMVRTDDSGMFSGLISVPAVRRGDYTEHTIEVFDMGSRVVLSHVLIGEVWLCSGQSNMQFALREVTDSTAEVAAADFAHMRLLDVGLNFSATPLENFKGRWTGCRPATAAKFSAVGYFFGREMMRTLEVPVGVVFSGIGASAAQAYVPQDVLAADRELDSVYLLPYLGSPKSKETIDGGFSFEKVTRPFLLYNAMIYPLRRMSFKGICWYQGESNRHERASYTHLMQALIRSWRQLFGQGELPFYYVQVAPFFYDHDNDTLADCSFFREAQERVSALNNTAMVTTVDVGEAKNLHPHNKKPIGIRLAKTALNRIYGYSGIVWRGPQYEHIAVNGRKIVVFFQPGTVAGGLKTDDGAAPRDFWIAGADRKFYRADAVVVGDRVEVMSKSVKAPVAVRYAFTNMAVTHFFNGEGWPVVPFRTDDWEEVK